MGKKNTKTKNGEGVELRIVPDTRAQVREGLLQSAIMLGLEEIASMLEDERSEVCGPRHARLPDRLAVRNGSAPSELVLGGRRVSMRRPRARTRDDGTPGSGSDEATGPAASTRSPSLRKACLHARARGGASDDDRSARRSADGDARADGREGE